MWQRGEENLFGGKRLMKVFGRLLFFKMVQLLQLVSYGRPLHTQYHAEQSAAPSRTRIHRTAQGDTVVPQHERYEACGSSGGGIRRQRVHHNDLTTACALYL